MSFFFIIPIDPLPTSRELSLLVRSEIAILLLLLLLLPSIAQRSFCLSRIGF